MRDQSFAKRFDKAEKTLSRRLRAYLKDPDARNVHDLRTATRRMLAAVNLLPKKARDKKSVRKLVDRYTELLKLNAKVRDLDIILAKSYGQERGDVFVRLVKKLEKFRAAALKSARRLAREIENRSALDVRPRQFSAARLQNRLVKVVTRFSSRIEARLPVVLTNPMGKEALHLLREDSRWLRYSLEIGTSKSDLVPFLRVWQNALGTVRDYDVVIEYFQEKEKPAEIAAWIEREKEERIRAYERFSALAKERPSFNYSAVGRPERGISRISSAAP